LGFSAPKAKLQDQAWPDGLFGPGARLAATGICSNMAQDTGKETQMKLRLHHVNLSTDNVERMDRFYRDVLGLDRETEGLPVLEKRKGYAGDVAFVTDGAIQTHLAERDAQAGFRAGQFVNPVSHGHIAYRTDDLAAFKAHLEANAIPYADWSNQAVAGWSQIFFYDPDGNVIEVHEVDEDAS
jgi:catechol 2,3-dioxygenase-like lactoylglutathione lyase family enzyme